MEEKLIQTDKMKQTAVDWLINEIDMQYPEINVRRKEWMLDKAKQMEKEQIKEAYKVIDLDIQHEDVGEINSEEYYNETYKSENKKPV